MSFVYARVLTPLAKVANALGLPFASMASAADIDVSLIALDDAIVPAPNYFRLQQAILERADNQDMGLLAGRIFYLESFHLYMYLASLSTTMREWINLLPSVSSVSGSVSRLQTRIAGDHLVLEACIEGGASAQRCLITDVMLSSAVLLMDGFSVLPVRPVRVEFCCGQPTDTFALEEFFRAPLQFNCPQNAIYYDKKILDFPQLHVSTQIYDSAKNEADRFLSDFSWESDVFTLGLYSLLRRKLPTANYSVKQIAASLNMSTRTLQRRLEARGTNFQHFLQQVKASLALRYLLDKNLNILEVAMLLGYSDSAAFSTAFKSWHGCTPREFRRDADS